MTFAYNNQLPRIFINDTCMEQCIMYHLTSTEQQQQTTRHSTSAIYDEEAEEE